MEVMGHTDMIDRAETFADDASGASIDRPELQKALRPLGFRSGRAAGDGPGAPRRADQRSCR